MKSTDLPALVGTPFGENGIKTPISQNTSPGTNAASYNDGFPAITMTELNNGGLPPRGSDFNQILYELAKSVQWAGTGALYKFSAEFATKIGGYPKGSKVIGSDGDVYECLIDDNMNDPVGGAGWINKREDKNTRELWRRSLAEAGFTLVPGSFEEGLTITDKKQAGWHIAGGQCFAWDGDLSEPKVVPAGSTPESTGGQITAERPTGDWDSVGDTTLRISLARSTGIDLTGYQASFKTFPRTTGDRLRDEVYLMDYIPEAEHDAIRNYTSTYDCADAIEAALLDKNCALLPPGLFLVKRTLEVGSFKVLKGQFPGHMFFGGRKSSVIQSKTEYLGDGNPILKGSSSGATQSLTCENLVFIGDTVADHTNLAAMSSVGIVAVNVRGIKQGVQFLSCAFRNIKRAVDDEGAGDYVDKVTFDKCQFMYNYLAVKCFPTTTMAFANCFFDECYDWIEGADVHLQTCRFNNSSYSSVTCQIKADKIVAENPYFEGGSRCLSPSRYLSVRGGYFSEAFSITGADKFSIQPRGSNIYIDIEGVRVGTNTRLIDFEQVTDISKVKVRVVGCHAGSNFGNTTALSYYLARGLSFEGGANTQSDWNVVVSGSPQLNGVAASRGDGVTRRFPNLNRSVYFDTSSIVFSLDFPQDIHTFPSTALTLDQATFSLIGTNNGDGNNAAYFARLTIYNGYGSIWNYYLDGPSAAAYTVVLSSPSNTGVIVTITRVNAGRGDNLVLNSSTENCKITFTA